MKTLTGTFLASAVVLTAAVSLFSASPAQAQSEEQLDAVSKRKSVFETKSGNTDPFFPRRKTTTPEKKGPVVVEVVDPYKEIALNGITIGAGGKRLAMINNQTIAAGETDFVRTAHGRVKVSCLEVKEASAVIQAEGLAPKELFLKTTF